MAVALPVVGPWCLHTKEMTVIATIAQNYTEGWWSYEVMVLPLHAHAYLACSNDYITNENTTIQYTYVAFQV